MKMSDYFILPLTDVDIHGINHGCTIECKNDGVAPFHAAEHAINNHDRLVESLELIVDSIDDRAHFPAVAGLTHEGAFIKAQELLKEINE